ncbi:hypothetical protein AMES_0588 [Amycolatopsis mediterranei S699]|uniref:DUF1648 domain-containing protein n=2 Tax=Amycolatopsis mediterranei TaxID=33910 RepID=A0A0H3CWI7_AMYMU|nr:hypothetical protein [Amycolatopsis mediterranei]ADJ42410.1 conserved hypothetical protein [Amycolatopsis mediterranei U32]AEK39096.1 hypothetical protein RAM_03020 [Amycolatopsis mediterranei S699]AFO74124.1 hypothetical protein AMES_0588 [Amycolatopsis mediterranei S699]AGT81253.1 hypothetical protein B737_0589 [Amycolatopsis mediterranei RB]KDO09681.1 hypothetical protein DV26_16545 [Amycolatopsis mediterranei]
MTKLIRVLLATAVLPGAALAVAGVLENAWAHRLPDPVATHWSSAPNGHNSLAAFTGISLGLGAVAILLLATSAVTALRRGRPLPRPTVGVGAGFAALPAAVLLSVVVANLDAPDWHAARSGVVVVPFLLGAAVIGVVAALVGALPAPPPGETPGHRPTVGLRPGERAFWSGRAVNPAMLWALALIPVAIALLPAGLPWPTGAWIALVGLLVTALTYRLSATVDAKGVTVRFGLLGVPWRHWALAAIREATTRELTTFGDGGLGLRFNPVTGTTAYKVRGGPALALTLENGRTVLVSVDDPETGAGLVNDLLAQRITRID